MQRREYLKATAGITTLATVPLAGCSGGDSTGTLATSVSDQPGDIGDFETCVVTIIEIRIKPVDEEEMTRSVDDAEADLVQLQGDAQQLVDESELATGEYEYVHLSIPEVSATLDDGSDATVDTAGEAGLKFQTFVVDGEQSESFEVREGETTGFTADFTPVKQGQTNEYVLKPVADEVTVSYESEETETDGGNETA